MTGPAPRLTDPDGQPSADADRLAERLREQREAWRDVAGHNEDGPTGHGWAPDFYEGSSLV